jgi:hypothetical protein
MPRQPLPTRLLHNNTKTISGPDALADRPAHAALIGQSLAAWSYIEAEKAVLLGVLLEAKSNAAVAVYRTLRRASGRAEAIDAAAQIVLTAREKEIVDAIMLILQSAEAERNALAHGCFISFNALPDAIVWVDGSKVSQFSLNFHLHPSQAVIFGVFRALDELSRNMLDNAYYYTIEDLKEVFSQIKTAYDLVRTLVDYLVSARRKTAIITSVVTSGKKITFTVGETTAKKKSKAELKDLKQRQERSDQLRTQEQFDQLCSLVPIQEALRVVRARAQAKEGGPPAGPGSG